MANKDKTVQEKTTVEFMDKVHDLLKKDFWGTIEPSDFNKRGEYYEDLKKVMQEALKNQGLI